MFCRLCSCFTISPSVFHGQTDKTRRNLVDRDCWDGSSESGKVVSFPYYLMWFVGPNLKKALARAQSYQQHMEMLSQDPGVESDPGSDGSAGLKSRSPTKKVTFAQAKELCVSTRNAGSIFTQLPDLPPPSQNRRPKFVDIAQTDPGTEPSSPDPVQTQSCISQVEAPSQDSVEDWDDDAQRGSVSIASTRPSVTPQVIHSSARGTGQSRKVSFHNVCPSAALSPMAV